MNELQTMCFTFQSPESAPVVRCTVRGKHEQSREKISDEIWKGLQMSKLKLLNQQMQETWVGSLGWKESLKKRMAIHSSILAGESHGQRSLVGYNPWGHKELDMTKQLTHIHRNRFHCNSTWNKIVYSNTLPLCIKERIRSLRNLGCTDIVD